MNKTITIIGINYSPEDTAIGLYTSQLASFFLAKGIHVNIITGFPYYPAWEISKEYKDKKTFLKENIDGVTVYRYKQFVPEKPTFFKRIIHLIDFTFGSIVNLFKVGKSDVILCIVPFTSVIFLGKILSTFKRTKLWVHIQDFEFDAVFESNILNNKNNPLFKLLFFIEKKLLNTADIISTISTSMIFKLNDKINVNKKRELLPNWVDLNFINPQKAKIHSYLKSSKFKILYSGNIGEKQDWNFFLKFVKALKDFNDIEVIVVGNGSKRDWLKEKIASMKNVSLYFPVPYNELPDLLCSADLHILFQKEDIIDTVMPSKILAMMASKKPLLVTGNLRSEVATIINKSRGGKYFSFCNFDEVKHFVISIKDDEKKCHFYGENSRNFVSLNFSKNEVLPKFEKLFISLLK